MNPAMCQEVAGKCCTVYTVHTEDMLEIKPDSKHRILFAALKDLRRGLTSSDVSIIIAIAENRQGKRLSSHQDQDEGDSSLMSGLHISSLWTCSSVTKYKTPVSGSLAVVVFIGTPTTCLWLSLLHKREQIRERCWKKDAMIWRHLNPTRCPAVLKSKYDWTESTELMGGQRSRLKLRISVLNDSWPCTEDCLWEITNKCMYWYVVWLYCNQSSLLHVSATYCGRLQGDVLRRNIT